MEKRKKSFTEIFFLFQPSKKVSLSSPRAFVLVMVAAESAECLELCGEVCFFLSFYEFLMKRPFADWHGNMMTARKWSRKKMVSPKK